VAQTIDDASPGGHVTSHGFPLLDMKISKLRGLDSGCRALHKPLYDQVAQSHEAYHA
jgi:hypothetical protein